MKGVWLQHLTWKEAADLFAGDPVVVIPVGAASKEHGPHLPLETDYLYARTLATRVAETLPVAIAPVVGFGYYPAFTKWAGSQHLRAETFRALMVDLLDGFVTQGVRRLAIVNTGVSTEPVLQLAVRDIRDRHGILVATADIGRLGRSADHLMAQQSGGHADERETSVMLAIDPSQVRMDAAAPDYGNRADAPPNVFRRPLVLDPDSESGADFSATGAIGDPTLATAGKGRAVLDAMADDLVSGLVDLWPDLAGD